MWNFALLPHQGACSLWSFAGSKLCKLFRAGVRRGYGWLDRLWPHHGTFSQVDLMRHHSSDSAGVPILSQVLGGGLTFLFTLMAVWRIPALWTYRDDRPTG